MRITKIVKIKKKVRSFIESKLLTESRIYEMFQDIQKQVNETTVKTDENTKKILEIETNRINDMANIKNEFRKAEVRVDNIRENQRRLGCVIGRSKSFKDLKENL